MPMSIADQSLQLVCLKEQGTATLQISNILELKNFDSFEIQNTLVVYCSMMQLHNSFLLCPILRYLDLNTLC